MNLFSDFIIAPQNNGLLISIFFGAQTELLVDGLKFEIFEFRNDEDCLFDYDLLIDGRTQSVVGITYPLGRDSILSNHESWSFCPNVSIINDEKGVSEKTGLE